MTKEDFNILPAHRNLLISCSNFGDTLTCIRDRLTLFSIPFEHDGKIEFTLDQTQALGSELVHLRDLVEVLAEFYYLEVETD